MRRLLRIWWGGIVIKGVVLGVFLVVCCEWFVVLFGLHILFLVFLMGCDVLVVVLHLFIFITTVFFFSNSCNVKKSVTKMAFCICEKGVLCFKKFGY